MNNNFYIKKLIKESINDNLIKEGVPLVVAAVGSYILLGLAYERMRWFQEMNTTGMADAKLELTALLKKAETVIPLIKEFANNTHDDGLKKQILNFEQAARGNAESVATVFGVEDIIVNATAPRTDTIISQIIFKLTNVYRKFQSGKNLVFLKKFANIPYLGLFLLPIDVMITESQLAEHFGDVNKLEITNYLSDSLNGFEQILISHGII